MEYAGIAHFFERLFSVDTVKRHKRPLKRTLRLKRSLALNPPNSA
jgi:hypothetical protein